LAAALDVVPTGNTALGSAMTLRKKKKYHPPAKKSRRRLFDTASGLMKNGTAD
jgi:hypothetical protein